MKKSNLFFIMNSINFFSEAAFEWDDDVADDICFNFCQNPYHLVNPSPWPVLTSFSLLGLVGSLLLFFSSVAFWGIHSFFIVFFLIFCIYSWFHDVTEECRAEGAHAAKVQYILQSGIIFFIISEILFFFSFFWSYFHSGLVSVVWTNTLWPPQPVEALDPFGLPLFNTVLLLASGMSVTFAHRALFIGARSDVIISLIFTIVYGLAFTALQLLEYGVAAFSITDTTFGTTFFLLTGFHGLHVLVGSIMLLVVLLRFIKNQIDVNHHIGFEAAVWYWHFVDVVWLFLFVFIYFAVLK